jgi:hypothetical protein
MRKIAGRFRRRLGIEATGDPAMAIPTFIDVRERAPCLIPASAPYRRSPSRVMSDW